MWLAWFVFLTMKNSWKKDMQDDIVSKQALELMHVNVVLIFFSRSSYKTGTNFFHLNNFTYCKFWLNRCFQEQSSFTNC